MLMASARPMLVYAEITVESNSQGGRWSVDPLDAKPDIINNILIKNIPILPKGKVLQQQVFTGKSQLEISAEGNVEYSMDKTAPILYAHINHQKILANNTINVPKEYHILKLSVDDGKTGSGFDDIKPKLPDNFSYYLDTLQSSKQVDMYLILPTERKETTVYNISMLIKDRAGNSKNHEFKLRVEKNVFKPELIEEFRGENNKKFCKYSINYQYILNYHLNDLYDGDSKSTSYLEFIARAKFQDYTIDQLLKSGSHIEFITGIKFQDYTIDQLLKITPSVSGPVRYKTFLDQANQSVKFTFSALSTAKPIDEAIVDIEIPNELFVTTQSNFVGVCNYYLHESLFIEAGHSMQTYQYRIPVRKKIDPPKLTFELNKNDKTLLVNLYSKEPISFNTSSEASLSTYGLNFVRKLKKINDHNYAFIFEDIIEGKYTLEAWLISEAIFKGHESSDPTTYEPLKYNETYTIQFQPPVVKDFFYDYALKHYKIRVDDDFTPLDMINGVLRLDGSDYPVLFDKQGEAILEMEQPLQTKTATLFITDLMNQMTEKELTMAGSLVLVETKTNTHQHSSEKSENDQSPYIIKENIDSSSSSMPKGDYDLIPLGISKGNQQQYRIKCKNNATVSPKNNGGIRSGGGRSSSGGSSNKNDDNIVGKRLDHITSSLDISENKTSSCCIESKKKYVCIGCARSHANSGSLSSQSCNATFWLDKIPPEIHTAKLDVDNALFNATISDKGTPIDQLDIKNSVTTNDLDLPMYRYDSNQKLTSEDNIMGHVMIQYPQNPHREYTDFKFQVSDPAYNKTLYQKHVVTPKQPPDIEIKHYHMNDLQKSTSIFGYFQDESGLDIETLSISVDNQTCNVNVLEDDRLGKQGKIYRHTVYCMMQLAEGSHQVVAAAIDQIGLRSQVNYPFQLSYPPIIHHFTLLNQPPDQNQPIMEARITDDGQDLTIDGITLEIGGLMIPRNQYRFNQQSGLFQVVGPILLNNGMHPAKLLVTDSHQNQADAFLNLNVRNDKVADAGFGELMLNKVAIWELQNSNGDGYANPGEIVRVFFDLTNNSLSVTKQASATVRFLDAAIRPENNQLLIDPFQPGEQKNLQEGIDIRIDLDILSRDNRQYKSVPIELILTYADGRHARLTTDLAIYEPRQIDAISTTQSGGSRGVSNSQNTSNNSGSNQNNTQNNTQSNTPVSQNTTTSPNIISLIDITGLNTNGNCSDCFTITGTFDVTDSSLKSLTATYENNTASNQSLSIGSGAYIAQFEATQSTTENISFRLETNDGDKVCARIELLYLNPSDGFDSRRIDCTP